MKANNTINKLLSDAFEHFSAYLQTSDADAARYIHRTVRVHVGTDRRVPEMNILREVSDPFVFLTGYRSGQTYLFRDQTLAALPYVTLLVGSYGTGKTELAYRLSQFLRSLLPREQAPMPLPINLARCRQYRSVLDGASSAKLAQVLQAGLPQGFQEPRVWREVKRQIQSGEILLILDGLDEFSQNESRYRDFLVSLRKMLTEGEGPVRKFRVIVTMRREYLTVVDTKDARDALDYLTATDRLAHNVYLLELNEYSDPEIKEYFARRMNDADFLYEKVKESEFLFSTLRRPLLMKLFTDLAEEPEFKSDLTNLIEAMSDPQLPDDPREFGKAKFGQTKSDGAKIKVAETDHHGPGWLIDLYINHSHVRGEAAQRGLETTFHWNIDKLAERSVVLYREGRDEFEVEDIKAIRDLLEYPDKGPFLSPKKKAFNENPFLSVHKCPFLIRYGPGSGKEGSSNISVNTAKNEIPAPLPGRDYGTLRFAHRAFFEFFTAKGIHAEVKQHNGPEDAKAFNELVVNSDMRKFLQFFLGKEYFYFCIRESCGMNSPEGWGFKNRDNDYKVLRLDLDEALRILTEGMTYPEKSRPDVEDKIDWFLETAADPTRFHPGYLVYCFHAIATYIQERPWETEYQLWRRKFEPILIRSFECAVKRRQDGSKVLNPWWERLIERVLYVGLRLRYPSLRDHATQSDVWLENDWQEDTKKRVWRIIGKIERAVF